jgi:integrase
MRGHIRRRGKASWELKFDTGIDPATGKRNIQYVSVKGTRKDAQAKLAELLTAVGHGRYVEPSKITVSAFICGSGNLGAPDYVPGRIDQWLAAGQISPRTHERYMLSFKNQIEPFLGEKTLQRLSRLDLEAWHVALRTQGFAAAAHMVLGKALTDAERDEMIVKNVCRMQTAPRVEDEEEVAIVRDVPGLLERLKGSRLYVIALVAVYTGLRLGELLAVRWGRVDLDKGVLQVREALDNKGRIKGPKTKAGKRDITLPKIVVEVLREHRITLLEQRMKMGAGRLGPEDLLFADINGRLLRLTGVSTRWAQQAERIGMPEVKFHSLRHTHASQLIASGVDVVTISRRLGHSKPTVTLAIYAHLFATDDRKAAAAIDAALGG